MTSQPRSLDIDTVVETPDGEERASSLGVGDVWREFGDDDWLRITEADREGDMVLLDCAEDQGPEG